MKRKLRIISLIMFVIAAAFVAAALSNPALGHVIYIGDFAFGQGSGGYAMPYMRL